ncbi:MAG TPA: hypothetical protein VL947_05880 [Cytophagales bacterium]|nr:hypothetical protein [Cytophagales bacterium]
MTKTLFESITMLFTAVSSIYGQVTKLTVRQPERYTILKAIPILVGRK